VERPAVNDANSADQRIQSGATISFSPRPIAKGWRRSWRGLRMC